MQFWARCVFRNNSNFWDMKNLYILYIALLVIAVSGCNDKTVEPEPILTIVKPDTSFCIENPTAHDFMQRSSSTFDIDIPSFVNDRTFQNLRSTALDNGYRNDQSQSFAFDLPAKVGDAVHVTVYEKGGNQRLVYDETVEIKDSLQQFVLRNLVPGNTYHYSVTSGENVLLSGAVSVTGQLRMISIDGSWNIRDQGGWKGWGGNTVRYEQLYRGGSLGGQNDGNETYLLSDDDISELYRIGIRAHLDLRALPGMGRWPEGELLNSFSLGKTMLRETAFINLSTDFSLFYPRGCSSAVGSVAWIIRQLHEGHPVYYNCRSGADRTGMLGYLLLGLFGCDEYASEGGGNQLAIDYELTSLGMDEQGTVEYNTTGKHVKLYSNRFANLDARSKSYFFGNIRTLEAPEDMPALHSFMERCYYYLNRYFCDNNVPEAGRVFINKSELDWLVNFMLGITDREGNLLPGHTEKFVGPSWAVEAESNTLEAAYNTAYRQQYQHSGN